MCGSCVPLRQRQRESKVQSVKMSSGSVSHCRLRNASSMFFKLAILSLALGAVSLSPPHTPPGLLAAQKSPVPANEWGKCESHRLRKIVWGGCGKNKILATSFLASRLFYIWYHSHPRERWLMFDKSHMIPSYTQIHTCVLRLIDIGLDPISYRQNVIRAVSSIDEFAKGGMCEPPWEA